MPPFLLTGPDPPRAPRPNVNPDPVNLLTYVLAGTCSRVEELVPEIRLMIHSIHEFILAHHDDDRR